MSIYPQLNSPFTIGTEPAVILQHPYTEMDEWVTPTSDMECGISYTRYDNQYLSRRFQLNYPLISRAEVTVLENFFIEMRGRLGLFSFIDDQGVTWYNTRFDSDKLQVVYNGPTSYAVTVQLLAQPQASL